MSRLDRWAGSLPRWAGGAQRPLQNLPLHWSPMYSTVLRLCALGWLSGVTERRHGERAAAGTSCVATRWGKYAAGQDSG